MCGIAGIVGSQTRAEGLLLVRRMNAAMVHRGPDDEGEWAGDRVALGMRRLSIIDLAGGHQPMWTDDGVGIVYNGEVYNYRSLRDELEAAGYRLRTQSDTEVILNLYHRHGLAAIDRLQGMFGICLYDTRVRQVHLIRDRLGVKPIYYGTLEGRFHFASEIKAILAALATRPPLDRQSLHHYLTLRVVPGPATVWQGISKLEPGKILTLGLADMKPSIRRYWSVHFRSDAPDPGRDYLREFGDLFLPAVEKRLLAADVPVGIMLSGGLDSSAICAAAAELGHRDLHTFSVAFTGGGEFDETRYARMVAAHTGSRHHEVVIGEREFMEFLPDLPYHTDEPLADLASIPLYYVSKLARSEVKVVLSGEGSDEVLAGYNWERLAQRYARIGLLERWAPRVLLGLACGLLPRGRYRSAVESLLRAGTAGFLSDQATHMPHHWSEAEKAMLWHDATAMVSTDELIREWYRATPSRQPLDQLQDVHLRAWLVEDLLMKADKMSMAASLELRVPFLDHALVEWAARLPHAWKVGDAASGPVSKRVLREFCRGRLPASILDRPKRGFPVPAYEWLTGRLGDWMGDLLLDPANRISGELDLAVVRPVLAAALQGDHGAAHRVWVLAIAEFWMRRWL